MYHRVAAAPPGPAARYCVTPEAFEAQLAYLRDSGFHGVDLDEWVAALQARRPLRGRAVAFTFDDGYRDFGTVAWPLLRRYGFGATVFLVADLVGGTNRWDAGFGDDVPLLDWAEVERLHAEGVRFGSHSASHPWLTALSPAEVVREAAASRLTIERRLRSPVTAFAYPYGDADRVVAHLVGACGYLIGVTCQSHRSGPGDLPLALPRIEIDGLDRIEDFALKLES
jgi:peptidoglycan/xylan/chitin deacetylase (PgdA/CDA1 family)